MPENYTPKLLDLNSEIVLFEGDVDTLTPPDGDESVFTTTEPLDAEVMANWRYTLMYSVTGKNYLVDDITDEEMQKAQNMAISFYSKMGLVKDNIFIPLYYIADEGLFVDDNDPASASIFICMQNYNFDYISHINDAPFHLKLGFNLKVETQEFTSFGGDKLFDLNNEKIVEKLKGKIGLNDENNNSASTALYITLEQSGSVFSRYNVTDYDGNSLKIEDIFKSFINGATINVMETSEVTYTDAGNGRIPGTTTTGTNVKNIGKVYSIDTLFRKMSIMQIAEQGNSLVEYTILTSEENGGIFKLSITKSVTADTPISS